MFEVISSSTKDLIEVLRGQVPLARSTSLFFCNIHSNSNKNLLYFNVIVSRATGFDIPQGQGT
jgi:hypothetical protein